MWNGLDPQHSASMTQVPNEGRWGWGTPCLDRETPPAGSRRPVGAEAQVGGPGWRKKGDFPQDLPADPWELPQAPRFRLEPRGSSPVGARAWQRGVAAPFGQGAAGVIANAEDAELVPSLVARIEGPVGHQCEVVAPPGEVSRGWDVLNPLWGCEALGG